MRISDWSSDVCSSDLLAKIVLRLPPEQRPCARDVEDIVVVAAVDHPRLDEVVATECFVLQKDPCFCERLRDTDCLPALAVERLADDVLDFGVTRSEEHTSELQSLMHISYADFCLTK